jgi:hypothetical protein
MRQNTVAQVFISHSHSDRDTATSLQQVIHDNGGQTYLDQDRLRAGDVLPDGLRQGIKACDTFLLIWSANAARSNWIDLEWNAAYEMRKRIVPYCLDSSALPPALSNLIYVDWNDRNLAHSKLLQAIFGRSFAPPSTEIFPGRWIVKANVFDLGGANYDLVLRANGQVTGTCQLSPDGPAADAMRAIGMHLLLSMSFAVSGSWSYEPRGEFLSLNLTASGFGQTSTETIQIHTTGRESGSIQGQDLAGRTYTVCKLRTETT